MTYQRLRVCFRGMQGHKGGLGHNIVTEISFFRPAIQMVNFFTMFSWSIICIYRQSPVKSPDIKTLK